MSSLEACFGQFSVAMMLKQTDRSQPWPVARAVAAEMRWSCALHCTTYIFFPHIYIGSSGYVIFLLLY